MLIWAKTDLITTIDHHIRIHELDYFFHIPKLKTIMKLVLNLLLHYNWHFNVFHRNEFDMNQTRNTLLSIFRIVRTSNSNTSFDALDQEDDHSESQKDTMMTCKVNSKDHQLFDSFQTENILLSMFGIRRMSILTPRWRRWLYLKGTLGTSRKEFK